MKTTQPRRYLVRPNQGLIAPGAVEKISILIVEKDKNQLLNQYESLGTAALDNCKDKFLVQSVAVTTEHAKNLTEYDQLTEFWTQIQTGNNNSTTTAMANKKLHVRHKVTGSTTAGSAAPATALAIANPERLTKEQLLVELQNLRKKYDELVSFSVNLTAERDVLNNSLEQTRRDLNRELNANTAAGPNKSRATATSTAAGGGGGPSMVTVLIYVVTALLLGAKLQQMGYLRVGIFFGPQNRPQQRPKCKGANGSRIVQY